MRKEKEVWKDVVGYEGKYQISNYGRVKSLQYHNPKGGKRVGILKLSKRNGYFSCSLSKNNIVRSVLVHRIVAESFIDNPNNYPQVNHINGIKSDNRAENLEWCTGSMNTLHALRMGLFVPAKPKNSQPIIVEDKESGNIMKFDSISDASKYLNVDWSSIKNWLTGHKSSRKIYWRYIIKYGDKT